jgi:hypothetical protein
MISLLSQWDSKTGTFLLNSSTERAPQTERRGRFVYRRYSHEWSGLPNFCSRRRLPTTRTCPIDSWSSLLKPLITVDVSPATASVKISYSRHSRQTRLGSGHPPSGQIAHSSPRAYIKSLTSKRTGGLCKLYLFGRKNADDLSQRLPMPGMRQRSPRSDFA